MAESGVDVVEQGMRCPTENGGRWAALAWCVPEWFVRRGAWAMDDSSNIPRVFLARRGGVNRNVTDSGLGLPGWLMVAVKSGIASRHDKKGVVCEVFCGISERGFRDGDGAGTG